MDISPVVYAVVLVYHKEAARPPGPPLGCAPAGARAAAAQLS